MPGESFCCTGCEAVHGALQGAGLSDWYRLREVDRDAVVGVAARPRDDRAYAYLDTQSYRDRHCQAVGVGQGEHDAAWSVDGMTCVACAWLIEEVARKHDGVRDVRVDLLEQRMELRFADDAKLSEIAREIARFGYGVALPGDGADPGAARRSDLIDVAVAGALMGNTMLLVLPYYAGLETGRFAVLFGWLSMLLATVSLAVPGRVFLRNAWAAAGMRMVSLDVPIALGLVAAWIYSLVQLVRGAYDQLFLDSLVMLVFSLRVGRFFQARTVERATARTRLLAASMPDLLHVLREGRWIEVAAEQVLAGETVRVDPGQRLPAEARLLRDAEVDLQVVSGEEAPRRLQAGATLPLGARAVDVAFEAEVLEPPELTAAPSLATGTARRTPMLADRLGGAFTAFVIAAALAGFAYWAAQDGVGAGLQVAMVVLIVACPCAIGLATPTATSLAIADAARRGVLIREPSVLERTRALRAIVFDKTGTVTEGRPEVERTFWLLDEADRVDAVSALADLEATSRHPVARGVTRSLEGEERRLGKQPRRSLPESVELEPGAGIRGSARGMAVAARSADADGSGDAAVDAFVADAQRAGLSVVVLWREAAAIGALALRDALRADARAVIDGLRAEGLHVELLSGDHSRAVAEVAERLGLQDASGGVGPSDKAARIEALQREFGAVAMVGDGQNDVLALRGASLAVTLAGATPDAIGSSEIVLQSGGLAGLSWALQHARSARSTIRATLLFAGIYNLFGIGWALSGGLTPLAAAVLMPLSSASVVTIAVLMSRSASSRS